MIDDHLNPDNGPAVFRGVRVWRCPGCGDATTESYVYYGEETTTPGTLGGLVNIALTCRSNSLNGTGVPLKRVQARRGNNALR